MNRTPTETAERTDAEKHIPPCRLAGFYRAPCPLGGRKLTLKALRYTHVCARSFDPAERAREQHILAHDAIHARMAPLKQPAERRTEQTTDKRSKYAHLIQF